MMDDLPREQLLPYEPFTNAAIDYFGSFTVLHEWAQTINRIKQGLPVLLPELSNRCLRMTS